MAEDFRQMKKKVIEILIAISFILLCIVLIVRFLATPINSADPRKLSNADIREIQRVKAAAEIWQWEELLKEAKFEVKKYDYKISRIPQTAFFWTVAAWSALGACILSVLILVTFAGITGKQLMIANPDAVVLALMTLSPKSEAHYKFLQEAKKTERAALQFSPQQELEIIDADSPINIALPLVVPPASKCLEMGLISQDGDRFLYGFDTETGEPHFGNLKESKSDIAIIGGKQRGKTWNAVNIAVQHFYKGAQGIVIDIHSQNEKSFTSYLSDWKENLSIKWCEDRNQVTETLQFIVAEIDRRLKLKTYENRLIVVADECLQLVQIAPKLFKESIMRIVTEGDKIGMNFIGISHAWKGAKYDTELRDNIYIGISHLAKPGQSNMLFKDNEVAKMTESLKDGEFIMRDEKTEVHRLSVPVWDSTTLKRMADSAPVHPLVIDDIPQQVPSSVAILAERRNRQHNTW
jgi:hypothetical protein